MEVFISMELSLCQILLVCKGRTELEATALILTGIDTKHLPIG